MTGTDLIRQITKKCRPLAATARSADDRAFWLGLIERWLGLASVYMALADYVDRQHEHDAGHRSGHEQD
jgi:hypothetical protein